MYIGRFIAVLLLILLLGCQAQKTLRESALLKRDKVMLKEEGTAQYFYWELDDIPQLWEPRLGRVNSLLTYKDSLKIVLGASALERAIAKESTQQLSKDSLVTAKDGDRINAVLVHSGAVGNIRPINFLEAQILNYQISRFPMLSHPTEFHGFIAHHALEQKVRVYFCASEKGWPPRPNVLIDHLEKEMENGWKLKYHLHNHYCEEDGDYVGILAPSLADAQYFKMLDERFKVEQALITNGFHTVALIPEEFYKFESH